MKIIKKIQLKIVNSTAVKKCTYIAWACYRNGESQQLVYLEIAPVSRNSLCVLHTVPGFEL